MGQDEPLGREVCCALVRRGQIGHIATHCKCGPGYVAICPQCQAGVRISVCCNLARRRRRTGAIVAYNGGIPPVWVEGVARLHPKHPPVDVPPNRWGTFINDVHRFLDSPFCAAAMALGWKAHDLFGCDRGRPFARIDQAGLLWLLNGDQVIALTADTAVIERETGARQTWRRKATETTQVLVWELRSPCAARR
jgi:hypothetical protein